MFAKTTIYPSAWTLQIFLFALHENGPVLLAMVKRLRTVTPWAKRFPRKPYNRTKRDEKASKAVPVPRLDIARLSCRQAAAAPADDCVAKAATLELSDRRQLPHCPWAVRLTKGLVQPI